MPLSADGPINILITGAAGFIGSQLAARLLNEPQYRVLLTDVADPVVPTGVAHPEHATALSGDIASASFVADLLAHPAAARPLHAVFVLHGIMSAAAEADYDLSVRVNVDSVRLLAEALRASHPGVRVVYASSLAVFGPPAMPGAGGDGGGGDVASELVPGRVPEGWPPHGPRSTYGAHKLLGEVYLGEMHRRGFLDVIVARLPTVAVRPGRPTGAASSFLSGIVREPMAGAECVVPIEDRGFRAWLASPRTVVENLVRVLRIDSGALPPHARQLMFPGIAVSVQELRDALARHGGEDRLRFIREQRDERLEGILRSWPADFDITTPLRLGLAVDQRADDLVRQYIEGLRG